MELRTLEEKRRLAEDHLRYEIEMVAGLVGRLTRQRGLLVAWPQSIDARNHPLARELVDIAGRNADIESLGIHLRILIDFLYDARGKPDDAIASDFFADPLVWRRRRPKLSADLKEVRRRVGTEIVHLSYNRVSPSLEWDEERLWNAISDVVRCFLDSADQERIDEVLTAHLRRVLDAPVTDRARAVLTAYAGLPNWVPEYEVKRWGPVPVPSAGTATTAPSYAVQHGLLYESLPDAD